ncbi:alpha/beta fold hydrolase [Hymenobacter volaticus]|uniref:Alpha/beta fold hydrolase n=1 Tax=Hymenobacter volaticus TaxID=2932254 RepID=A0ABY4GDL3_9BACT|nr:alpha/beta fold hydrolase [Hymenobacter volaticus]UOQ69013.1 alpha/beta fold hydrolase [Hymenobacter volaticus]
MKKTILVLTLVALSTVFLSACSKKDEELNANPKTFVLVHGAWQAPYVWDAVKANLQKQGAQVITVELPGHGADQSAPQTLTLDVYRDNVIEALSKVNGKVILVGHSLGGMVISAVAERVPSKIEKLVYIAAYLPVSGQSLKDLAQTDKDSQLSTALIPSADQLTFDVAQAQLVNIFIEDGSDAVKKLVLQNYRPEPAIPFTNAVSLTASNYGSVAKVYIKTLQDHAVSPALQASMIKASGVKSVYQLDTSHSPFLSKPDAVSSLLSQIAQ